VAGPRPTRNGFTAAAVIHRLVGVVDLGASPPARRPPQGRQGETRSRLRTSSQPRMRRVNSFMGTAG
jgi:hypothetical protein